MSNNTIGLNTAQILATGAVPAATDPAALDKAFEALKNYDRGTSRGALTPIDNAARAALRDPGSQTALEQRLSSLLKTKLSPVAKEYICGKLALIGSAASVSSLAELLSDKDLSHAARNALQTMPCPEAVEALRVSLPKLSGVQQAGVIDSLGARRDATSVPALAQLLAKPDSDIAAAAASALGKIGNLEAATTLRQFWPKAPATIRPAIANAALTAAERLLDAGRKTDALAIYQMLAAAEAPKQVKLAATRGLLLAGQKK